MSGTYINIDFCDLFLDFEPRDGIVSPPHLPMNEDGLRQELDYYAVPGVSAVIFNLNAMRAMFDSHTFDPVWKGLELRDGKPYYRGKAIKAYLQHDQEQVVLQCRELYRNVPDPQKIRYDYCHKKGVDMYISMRMNDVHWVDNLDLINHGDLWREHPEFRRAMFKKDYTFWFSQCFDYGRPEVYEHHLALVREYFDRFEMDGFELDWMRSPFFFRPGEEDKGRAILTKFMEDVKKIAVQAEQKRGHKIRIAVRVHSWPEDALSAGLDVVSWARKGLVDMVVPSPYYGSVDNTMPVELWKMLLPDHVELSPCLDCQYSTGAGVSTPGSPELDAGTISAYCYRGADSIYLFNHMLRCSPYGDRFDVQQKCYTVFSDRKKTESSGRRHAATFRESIVEGKQPTFPFGSKIPKKGCMPVKIDLGGATAGRQARIFIASSVDKLPDGLEVYLNSRKCEFNPAEKCYPKAADIYLQDYLFRQSGKFFFDVPEGVARDGINQIDLVNTGNTEIPLTWAEIVLP